MLFRSTGMPGFKDALTDQQAWQVSALLARADKLSPDVLALLKPGPLPAILAGPQMEPAAAPSAPASDPTKQK